MSLDIVMHLYVALEDFDECLESIVERFDEGDKATIITPSGRRIACPGKRLLSFDDGEENDDDGDENDLPLESDLREGIAVSISEGEYALTAEFGELFAKLSLGWVSPYSISDEQYEDLLNYVDPSVKCARTVGLPGEMAPLIQDARGKAILDQRRALKQQKFDSIDNEAKAWHAVM